MTNVLYDCRKALPDLSRVQSSSWCPDERLQSVEVRVESVSPGRDFH